MHKIVKFLTLNILSLYAKQFTDEEHHKLRYDTQTLALKPVFLNQSSISMRPGTNAGVWVCRLVKLIQLSKLFLYGPCFEHKTTVILENKGALLQTDERR